MEKEEKFSCSICYKLPKEAVQCKTQKCKKLYCLECVNQVKRNELKELKNAKCPYCRTQPFQIKQSPFRKAINSTLIKCIYCKKGYQFIEIQKHESVCEDQSIACKLCPKVVKRKEIVAHTKDIHTNNVPNILKSYHQSVIPIPNPQEVINKFVKTQKNYGKIPHLGTTGKFYCGQKLGLVCNCCNGFCGPTNGQNCPKCMKLDLIRKGLTKGYLVNGRGAVCWKDSKGHFTCGQLYFRDENQTCGDEGKYCKFCRNTTISQERYKDLLQKE